MEAKVDYLVACVEKYKDKIYEAERYLWTHPETGYREWNTNEYMASIFRDFGYELTYAGNIPGFYTVLDTGKPGPTICAFAEMDSLINELHPDHVPGTNAVHSCGHHAQMAAMVGLAGALKEPGALDGMSGKIKLCLVPAEEGIESAFRKGMIEREEIRYMSGKAEFLYRGFLDDVDAAFVFHSGVLSEPCLHTYGGFAGALAKNVVFHGKACHAANAKNGVNALYAASQALSACNAMRETFDPSVRWHPILPECTTAVNAIPDRVVMESMVRGSQINDIVTANQRINRAIAGSAASVGATATIEDDFLYAPATSDQTLTSTVISSFKEIFPDYPAMAFGPISGSTDLGFLSPLMPVMQLMMHGGIEGATHSAKYRILDPEYSCLNSAKTQAVLLWNLLKDDAKVACEMKKNYKKLYTTKEEMFEVLDSLNGVSDVVEFVNDHEAILRF